jgi:hypothetical protein
MHSLFTQGPLRHELFGEVPQWVFKTYYLHNAIILCITIGSMGQLGKGQGPQNAEL